MLKRFPTNIREIEAALLEIESAIDSLPLPVPTHARNLGPAGEAALVQLITTWAAKQARPVLHTYATSSTDPQLVELVRRQYGLAAAIMCSSARARSVEIDVTQTLKSEAFEQLVRSGHDAITSTLAFTASQDGQEQRSSRGRAAEIMCADHLDLIQKCPFYVTDSNGYRILRDLKGFTVLVNRIFDRLVPPYYRRNFNSEFRNAMGAFSFELVGNTHDHARTDVQGRLLSKSLRGLYARHYELGLEQLLRTATGFEPLESYFQEVTSKRKDRPKFVELSVYDCGPGLAQRWTGTELAELTADQETAAVRDCFQPGATTKKHSSFGGGLPLVLRLLADHKGFVRVRTGHLSLYWSGAQSAQTFDLKLWTLPSAGKLAEVVGTTVSVIVPVPAP